MMRTRTAFARSRDRSGLVIDGHGTIPIRMTEPLPRRVLFVCRYNRMRSPTAERLFCKRADLDVRSAGTSQEALACVNAKMLDWADIIFIMDEQQRDALQRSFPGHSALARLICLDIADEYTFLQPELIDLLETKVTQHLPAGSRGTDGAPPSTPPAFPGVNGLG